MRSSLGKKNKLAYVKEKGRITNKEYRVEQVSKQTATRDLKEPEEKGILNDRFTEKGIFYILKGSQRA